MSYPISLQLSRRRVLVVGAGPVAARRIPALLDEEASVTVVAPYACEDIVEWAGSGALTWHRRDYRRADLDGAWLVLAHTGSAAENTRIADDADAAGIWALTGGDAAASRVWLPAVARVEDVTVAVNAAADPARAVAIRNAIAAELQVGALPLRRRRRSGSAGSSGTVALVGGGPGDDSLITTAGRRLLARADVVVADRLGPRRVLEELDDDVLVIDVGKSPGHHTVGQEEINRILVEHALAGRQVVRLKGGDPFVLGRGGEEQRYCREHGVDVRVVPGITSAVSVPAAAGIPVTHRGIARGFSVITGHEDIRAQAGSVPGGTDHTLVLLMAVARLADSAAALIDAGRPASTPVAVVERGWAADQRVTFGTLETIGRRAAAVGVRSPAVVVVGDVVTLSPDYPAPEGTRP